MREELLARFPVVEIDSGRLGGHLSHGVFSPAAHRLPFTGSPAPLPVPRSPVVVPTPPLCGRQTAALPAWTYPRTQLRRMTAARCTRMGGLLRPSPLRRGVHFVADMWGLQHHSGGEGGRGSVSRLSSPIPSDRWRVPVVDCRSLRTRVRPSTCEAVPACLPGVPVHPSPRRKVRLVD